MVPLNADLSEVQASLTRERQPFAFKVFHKDGVPYITLDWDRSMVTIYFSREEAINQILVQSRMIQSESEVKEIVDRIKTRFGPPNEIRSKNREEDERAVTNYIWWNKSIELKFSVVHYKENGFWILWEDYSPKKEKPGPVQEVVREVDRENTEEP